ncbi:MAG TPA: DNA polymerase III subunit alpha [Patescibacteria group bacterium]|jgi:DNA polymerase-3 subunit alpha
MPKPKFVHLHVHSHYSLLDGLSKLPDLSATVKKQGMDALALTDHGVLYGAVEFYQAATKAGIKPIIGCEVYVARRGRKDKDPQADVNPYHLILLAQNKTGYKNLLKLVTAAHLEGFYYKPRIDWDLLQEHHEGLICTSACLQGEVANRLRDSGEAEAKKVVDKFAKLFGDRYYLELQHHPNIPEQGELNAALVRIAKEKGLPLIGTNDAHYVRPDDSEAQDVLVCIQTGKQLDDTDRLNMTNEDFSLQTPQQMAQHFADTPEAVSNTAAIAGRCDLELDLGKIILPKFEVPEGETERSLLRKQVAKGVETRYGASPGNEVTERIEYELGVIEKMGFESYFLIVGDLVREAKSRGIWVGPGRGSAAGSLVSYVLDITTLDPLEYDLLFERFLNPDRISMPDIDMDFADDRRQEVIDYTAEKYGKDRVAQIITFGTMAARAAVRDTGRVMGLTYGEVDQVAKLIPFGMDLKEARKQPELKELASQSQSVDRLLDLASRIEGSVRHASTHAAGVVIGDRPLVDHVPLQHGTRGDDQTIVTQYSMYPIEDIGLLKMDFLGLSNLTILRNATEIIEAVHGDKIDVEKIPLDDAKTFELLCEGRTYGIFQLESEGMRRYIKELRPTQFEDIVAMVSLYRPGPMQWIDSFIKRKHGRERVTYVHPKVENALKETYGVIVYQEQVMQISKDLAGFTGGEADTLRKAVGKKIASLLAEQKEKFVSGAVENGGMERGQATQLFGQLEDFARYAFNKSHAACYALIAYQTAYLKARYPSAFMAALMTSEQEDLDKLSAAITDAESIGIKVLPPDVNESFQDFAVASDKKSIRFGLNAIKNLGKNTAAAIVASRKADGPFKGLNDFLSRLPDGTANKKSLEALIKAGALDGLAKRGQLLAGLEAMARYAAARAAENRSGQSSLFGDAPDSGTGFTLPSGGEVDQRQKLEWERELLGMYVSEHPLSSYGDVVKRFAAISVIANLPDKRPVEIACLVSIAKRINTKKGDPMAFVTVEDRNRKIEVIVFPKLYLDVRDRLHPGTALKISGKISRKDDEPKILADKVEPLDEEARPERPANLEPAADIGIDNLDAMVAGGTPTAPHQGPVTDAETAETSAGEDATITYESLTVRLGPNTTLAVLEQVKGVLSEHRGESPVYLILTHGESEKKLKLAHGVRYSKGLIDDLEVVDWNVSVEAR